MRKGQYKPFVPKVVSIWKLLEKIPYRDSKGRPKTRYKAQCIKCGHIGIRDERSIKRKDSKRMYCTNCKKGVLSKYGITEGYYNDLKRRAINRKKEFSVSFQYIIELFEKQKGICPYTGRKIEFVKDYEHNRQEQTASLDRIYSNKGYIEGNLQWIHKEINSLKGPIPHDRFLDLCEEIAQNQKKKKRA